MAAKDSFKSFKTLGRKPTGELEVSRKLTRYEATFEQLLQEIEETAEKKDVRKSLGYLAENLDYLGKLINEGIGNIGGMTSKSARLFGFLTSIYAEESCKDSDRFLIPDRWARIDVDSLFYSLGSQKRISIKGNEVGAFVCAYAKNIGIELKKAELYLLYKAENSKAKVEKVGQYAGREGKHLYIEVVEADDWFLNLATESSGKATLVGDNAGDECKDCKLTVDKAGDSFLERSKESEGQANSVGNDAGYSAQNLTITVKSARDNFLTYARDSIGTAETVGVYAAKGANGVTLHFGNALQFLLESAVNCKVYCESFAGRAGRGSENCFINDFPIPSGGVLQRDLR